MSPCWDHRRRRRGVPWVVGWPRSLGHKRRLAFAHSSCMVRIVCVILLSRNPAKSLAGRRWRAMTRSGARLLRTCNCDALESQIRGTRPRWWPRRGAGEKGTGRIVVGGGRHPGRVEIGSQNPKSSTATSSVRPSKMRRTLDGFL